MCLTKMKNEKGKSHITLFILDHIIENRLWQKLFDHNNKNIFKLKNSIFYLTGANSTSL